MHVACLGNAKYYVNKINIRITIFNEDPKSLEAKAIELSINHVIDNPDEKDRVESCGARVGKFADEDIENYYKFKINNIILKLNLFNLILKSTVIHHLRG